MGSGPKALNGCSFFLKFLPHTVTGNCSEFCPVLQIHQKQKPESRVHLQRALGSTSFDIHIFGSFQHPDITTTLRTHHHNPVLEQPLPEMRMLPTSFDICQATKQARHSRNSRRARRCWGRARTEWAPADDRPAPATM